LDEGANEDSKNTAKENQIMAARTDGHTYIRTALKRTTSILAMLFLSWSSPAQNVGPISSGRLAWYDYSCQCPSGQLTCATCWKYLRLPPGAKIEPDPSGASDGILWTVEWLAAPGTNPGPAGGIRFEPRDFEVALDADGTQQVAIRWASPAEGGLPAGEQDWELLGFTTKPSNCTVFRDGLYLSWARSDYSYLPPLESGGNWRLRFARTAEESTYIVAHCIKAP
jgi:hypothetical protein